jgi:hypothetical protein
MAKSPKRFFLMDPLGGLTLLRSSRAHENTAEEPAARVSGSGVYAKTKAADGTGLREDGVFEDERPTRRLRPLKAG